MMQRVRPWLILLAWWAVACQRGVQHDVSIVAERQNVRLEHVHHHGRATIEGGAHGVGGCAYETDVDRHEYVLHFAQPEGFSYTTSCTTASGDVELAVDSTGARYAVRCDAQWWIYFLIAEQRRVLPKRASPEFDGTDAAWKDVPELEWAAAP